MRPNAASTGSPRTEQSRRDFVATGAVAVAGGVPLLTACATGEKDGTTSGNGVAKPLPAHVPGDVVTPDAPARDGTTVGSVLTLDRFGAAVLEEQP
ncbi:twin-arginine translocation signal domain-containing protein [Streptomyces roseolus]|uniref:twin-arginine translocation signal domain-containing protein n=1 Tax=Streptomyces roseolus TaxID=67358 RepID=UPI00364CA032